LAGSVVELLAMDTSRLSRYIDSPSFGANVQEAIAGR